MEREDYIKHIKKLIKTYHPDLCSDENSKKTYNEITIKLNVTLNRLENKEITINEQFIEDRNFDIFSFRYYFAKIQSIGLNKTSTKNKDYIIFRNFLISEINKQDTNIGSNFAFLLSDENIKNESIGLFANAYAGYNSIFQNYYQYKEQSIKQCIKIADSYFSDYIKTSRIKNIKTIIEETKKWLQETGGMLYKQRHFI
jgi:hypothetical protein